MRRFLPTKSVRASLMLNEILDGFAPAMVDGLGSGEKTSKSS